MWIPPLTKAHRAALSARLNELPKAERRPLMADVRRKTNRDRRVRIPIAAVWAGIAVGAIVPFFSRDWPLSWRIAVVEPAYAVAIFAAFWAAVAHARLIDRALAARFPNLCPTCGYDRRATPDRCPECGTESPVAPSPRR